MIGYALTLLFGIFIGSMLGIMFTCMMVSSKERENIYGQRKEDADQQRQTDRNVSESNQT